VTVLFVKFIDIVTGNGEAESGAKDAALGYGSAEDESDEHEVNAERFATCDLETCDT
jgi:hypothetical protein